MFLHANLRGGSLVGVASTAGEVTGIAGLVHAGRQGGGLGGVAVRGDRQAVLLHAGLQGGGFVGNGGMTDVSGGSLDVPSGDIVEDVASLASDAEGLSGVLCC